MEKKIAKENLFLLKKVFDANGVSFRLGFGTLLGAIRDKDFIVGDKDIDLVFLLEDKIVVESLLPSLSSIGFSVFLNKNNYLLLKRKGVQVDLYFFSKRNVFDVLFERVSCGYGLWCIFIPDRFNYAVPLKFFGVGFWGLPVEWLSYTYGNWWVKRNTRGSRSRTFTSKHLMNLRDFLRKLIPKEKEKVVRNFYRGLFK
jgi:hypothetical protein